MAIPASSAPAAIATFWTGNARAVGRGWLSQPSRELVGGGVLASDSPELDSPELDSPELDDMPDDMLDAADSGEACAGAIIRAVASAAASLAITPSGPLCGGIEVERPRSLA